MIIVHKCLACAHWEQSHTTGMCCHGFCPCKESKAGPSEAVDTYPEGLATPTDRVHEPGTYWNDDSVGPAGSRMRLCGCEECWAVYRQYTGGLAMQGDGPSW